MKWTLLLVAVAFLVLVFRLKATSTLPTAAAREQLKNGAVLVDVRTAVEYAAGHLTNAVNIPLDEIQQALPRRVADKGKPLLLHCRSGRRSGVAEQQLRALGYTNVFNVGSYADAERLVNGAK